MKTAIITGAAGYIGSAIAKRFAKEGISVAVCDINEGGIKKVVDNILSDGCNAKGYVIDVTSSASVDAVTNKVFEDFGSIDICVHVAGGSSRIVGKNGYVPLVDKGDEYIDGVLKVNLYGAFYIDRAAARIMIKQNKGGRIINISSSVGLNGLANCTEYAASKGGIISLTKSLAKELGQYKITVNSVAPGVVARPEVDESIPSEHKYVYETNFLGEKCTADDIAAAVNFVASDEAKFITGQVYAVDGGRGLAMKGSD